MSRVDNDLVGTCRERNGSRIASVYRLTHGCPGYTAIRGFKNTPAQFIDRVTRMKISGTDKNGAIGCHLNRARSEIRKAFVIGERIPEVIRVVEFPESPHGGSCQKAGYAFTQVEAVAPAGKWIIHAATGFKSLDADIDPGLCGFNHFDDLLFAILG